jgi:mRNA-degrading endonuclease RelE of RelBE toxin-antitoxin system
VNRDILRLEENPRPHGVKKLAAKEKLYRGYVGPGKNYRAMYQVRDEVLLVLVVKETYYYGNAREESYVSQSS